MTALAQASGDPGERQRVHDAIEVLLAKPEAHQLRLLEALTLVDLRRRRHAGGPGGRGAAGSAARGTVGEQLGLRGAAAGSCRRTPWNGPAGGAPSRRSAPRPRQSRVAHVVHRAYFLIWQQLREGGE